MRFYRVTHEWAPDRLPLICRTGARAAREVKEAPPFQRDEVLVEQLGVPTGADTIEAIWNMGPRGLPVGTLIERIWRGTRRGGLRELDPANITQGA